MTRAERMADFVDWYKYTTNNIDELVFKNQKFMNYLTNDGFFTAPASTKFHGAYEGGLYDHSRQVFLRLQDLTENLGLTWQRPESPFIVGMFHDLCKCDQYKPLEPFDVDVGNNAAVSFTPKENRYAHNDHTLLKGHGSKSVMILSQFINLTEEEMLCIRYHMGAYEKEEWTEFDLAIRKYPNVLMTHTADMLASKVDNI